ncbi:unnamed protein product [Effrenium voratum]|uniref:PCI domain-containing protein n=1 Tax=Effrenium voratum TaxID=2562239 RepID=A0AA36NBD2_9DINO|nr:unnamed protein product [Effrenium voratum]CAJ1399724.1 unnamed protein product [Effrenium voratum]CAJ1443041.1 unnamed protein product [Effrenium voratum]
MAGEGNDPMEVDEEVEASESAKKIFEDLLDKALSLEASDVSKAKEAYKAIIFKQDLEDPNAKYREKAIYALGDLLVAKKLPQDISTLSKDLRPLFADLPKAKTAKIVRHLIDLLAKTEGSQALQIEMCKDCIEWCKGEKRTFLRHRVETKLAGLYLVELKYQDSLELLTKLLTEVKKLDDKLLLVEIHNIECRVHYAVQNMPKAKAALTAAKTNANAIHCPPLLQAEIDLLSGIVSAREKDHRTAFSYFYEAFEAYHQTNSTTKARTAMKYMLLSKIMSNLPKDTTSIISSKSGLQYVGPEIDAMAAVASAHEARSLKKFEAVLEQHKHQLSEDPIIQFHLSDLNETLLEQNILRILEPFSRVEITHVAELIELPLTRTQAKLSEMILDQKLNGTLDQGIGVLIVFDQEQVSSTYDNSLKTIKNTSEVLDTLYAQAKQLA